MRLGTRTSMLTYALDRNNVPSREALLGRLQRQRCRAWRRSSNRWPAPAAVRPSSARNIPSTPLPTLPPCRRSSSAKRSAQAALDEAQATAEAGM